MALHLQRGVTDHVTGTGGVPALAIATEGGVRMTGAAVDVLAPVPTKGGDPVPGPVPTTEAIGAPVPGQVTGGGVTGGPDPTPIPGSMMVGVTGGPGSVRRGVPAPGLTRDSRGLLRLRTADRGTLGLNQGLPMSRKSWWQMGRGRMGRRGHPHSHLVLLASLRTEPLQVNLRWTQNVFMLHLPM